MRNQSVSTWHWPYFAQTLCGTMSDRERLGLPDHYVEGRLDVAITEAYSRCIDFTKKELLNKVESSQTCLAERIACGNLLALQGDSRIDVLNPSMVTIPAARVQVGLPIDKVDAVMAELEGLGLNRMWIEKECPQYSIDLEAFKLCKYPVTNAQYKLFLTETLDAEIPTSWELRRYPLERSNHPVYTVSARAADTFTKWLSERTGRNFRLPTEAEWEYAASGLQHYEFPWGAKFNADFANTAESGLFTSTPVGIFCEGYSPFGLADMAGNVEEYVSDQYQAYPDGLLVTDHLVDIHGQYRVARGGSFARFRDLARTRRRHGHNPKSATYAMGLRLAESLT